MACTECNELLIAPEWSEYVGRRDRPSFLIVRKLWSQVEVVVCAS